MAEIDNLIAEVNKKYKTDIIRKACSKTIKTGEELITPP